LTKGAYQFDKTDCKKRSGFSLLSPTLLNSGQASGGGKATGNKIRCAVLAAPYQQRSYMTKNLLDTII